MNRYLIAVYLVLVSFKTYGGVGPGITDTTDGVYLLKADGSSWFISFPKSDYQIVQNKHQNNGRSRYFHLSNKQGVNISFFIEPVNNCTSSSACRKYQIDHPSKSMAASIDVRTNELNNFSVIHYFLIKADASMIQRISELKGKDINRRNINAHFVRDGYWVDIHVSKFFSTITVDFTEKGFYASYS